MRKEYKIILTMGQDATMTDKLLAEKKLEIQMEATKRNSYVTC